MKIERISHSAWDYCRCEDGSESWFVYALCEGKPCIARLVRNESGEEELFFEEWADGLTEEELYK